MRVESICFSAPKLGNTEHDWEDGAAFEPGWTTGRAPDSARVIVADGATDAFESIKWVGYIVDSFIGSQGPRLTMPGLQQWFASLQAQWKAEVPAGLTFIEEQRFAQGSGATVLGCELTGLAGPQPKWEGIALGDTVLFHVRGGNLYRQLPPMSVADFDTSPDVVHTSPEQLEPMMAALNRGYSHGDLRPDDVLYLATDALAKWILERAADPDGRVWELLDGLNHPSRFWALVDEHRECGAMTNDDITLVRLRLTEKPPTNLVVCLP